MRNTVLGNKGWKNKINPILFKELTVYRGAKYMWQMPQRWDGENGMGFQILSSLLQIMPSANNRIL